MKKLLLFVVVAVSMAGCETIRGLIGTHGTIERIIDNQTTKTEISYSFSNFGEGRSIEGMVSPDEKKVCDSWKTYMGTGSEKDAFHSIYDIHDTGDDFRILFAKIKWSSGGKTYEWYAWYRFTEYYSKNDFHSAYTLVVTDELLAEVTDEDSEVRQRGALIETEDSQE